MWFPWPHVTISCTFTHTNNGKEELFEKYLWNWMGFSSGLVAVTFIARTKTLFRIFYRSQRNSSGFILGMTWNNVLVWPLTDAFIQCCIEGKHFIGSGIHWESNPWPCVASAAIYCLSYRNKVLNTECSVWIYYSARLVTRLWPHHCDFTISSWIYNHNPQTHQSVRLVVRARSDGQDLCGVVEAQRRRRRQQVHDGLQRFGFALEQTVLLWVDVHDSRLRATNQTTGFRRTSDALLRHEIICTTVMNKHLLKFFPDVGQTHPQARYEPSPDSASDVPLTQPSSSNLFRHLLLRTSQTNTSPSSETHTAINTHHEWSARRLSEVFDLIKRCDLRRTERVF